MAIQSFLPSSGNASDIPVPTDLPTEKQASRERIKHLLIGSPRVVTRTIYSLHVLGYAEVREWSKPQSAGVLGEPGEVISVLIRYVMPE